MPLLDWVKPPRHLLVVLILLTLVSVSALAWLGWRVARTRWTQHPQIWALENFLPAAGARK